MADQKEMQFLGMIGICKEAYKIVITRRKIFGQITLALIFPLYFISLAHTYVSHSLINPKTTHSQIELGETPDVVDGTQRLNKLSNLISSKWLLINLVDLIFLGVFSLLSTSAVVYTIACIYTGREVSFKKIMSVVPKIWKRLVLTYLSIVLAFFLYAAFATVMVFISTLLSTFIGGSYQTIMGVVFVMLFLLTVGFVYMGIVWQLANTVSVLEEWCGFKAMGKSKQLLKGKMWVATLIYLMLNVSSVIDTLFENFVVRGDSSLRWVYRMLRLPLVSMFFLFGLILQTLLYFVCKSYHHENIHNTTLSDRLDVYTGDYNPLMAKDVPSSNDAL